jgi:hypothetical protein
MQLFPFEFSYEFNSYFEDPIWLSRLAFLADIFAQINDLNAGLRGISVILVNFRDRISAVIKGLNMFVSLSENITSSSCQHWNVFCLRMSSSLT